MSQQQTTLRVQTNKIDRVVQTVGTFDIVVPNLYYMDVTGSGTTINPYQLSTLPGGGIGLWNLGFANFEVNGGQGDVYYKIEGESNKFSAISILFGGDILQEYFVAQEYGTFEGKISVNSGDIIRVLLNGDTAIGTLHYETIPVISYISTNLDLYNDIPIKLNKSFSELQDINKKNSDYTLGLRLPGSTNNNEFFENFFDVNVRLLHFNVTKRVPCSVLIDNSKYFDGYLRLNKINVKNSLVEYDVTLYSTIGNLFGEIGNNLIKDLDFEDPYHRFNHVFNTQNVMQHWDKSNFTSFFSPFSYIYPIIHNGYEYSGDTINFSGGTLDSQSRFFTTSSPIGSYDSVANFYAAGGKKYRANSPGTGLINNQLKPAMSMWHLVKLIFKTYGYTIKSEFMNTPWFKTLYMYGYFNNDKPKFSYKVPEIIETSSDNLEFTTNNTYVYEDIEACSTTYTNIRVTFEVNLVKKGTSTQTTTNQDVVIPFNFRTNFCYGDTYDYILLITIPAGQVSGYTEYYTQQYVDCGTGCPYLNEYDENLGLNPGSLIKESTGSLNNQTPSEEPISITDDTYVDFTNVVDGNLKQIDLISSIGKKFDLVFIPNPENPREIIIEPYSYYIGTGKILDWTNKLSYDKGFTVEPAINYIESVINLTDQEDGDAGNIEFKNRNNRIYGQNIVNNSTDFKSNEKKIETIFSPMIVRKWDADGEDNVGLPLGISYSSNNKEIEDGDSKRIFYYYSGVKTKPKLMYWLGSFNPFIDKFDEIFNFTKSTRSYQFHIRNSSTLIEASTDTIPVISHSMSIGNQNSSDSVSILYESEKPTFIDVETFNTYTPNDCYQLFYKNRIDNLYDPNTRFISGYFDIKLSDISNLNPEDLIKIGDKYFTWNKIDGYDYTNQELTKVELVQFNRSVNTYPTRYFKYSYCGDPTTVYKIKTDFTNPSMLYSNYYFSLQYDYNVGLLGGTVTGYTSTFKNVSNQYIPYTIFEVTESEYNNSGLDFVYDGYLKGITGYTDGFFHSIVPTYWRGTTQTGLNLFNNCTDYYSKSSTYGIITGDTPTPLPTPTPVPSPTPTPTPGVEPIIGSLLLDFDL